MDGTLRTWDIRPFVDDAAGGKKRLDKTFMGGTHNAEKGLLNCAWSSDGTMVTGGSADCVVHIWDEFSTEEVSMRMNSELVFIIRCLTRLFVSTSSHCCIAALLPAWPLRVC
jgi:WD40 repeat protein